MVYVGSIVVALVAVVVLGLVGVTLLGPVRRVGTATSVLGQRLGRDGGMLRARVAALQVRLAQRRA